MSLLAKELIVSRVYLSLALASLALVGCGQSSLLSDNSVPDVPVEVSAQATEVTIKVPGMT